MTDCHDPLAVFRAAVTAINTEDWAAAAALVDPECLQTFHHRAITGLGEGASAQVPTVDEFLRRAPNVSRARAEELIARLAQEADPAFRLAREFPDVSSIEQLRSLTPAELFSRWLNGKSMRRKFETLIAAGRLPAKTLEGPASGPFRGIRYVPVGSVADGDTFLHVLYRPDFFSGRRVVKDVPQSPARRAWEVDRPQRELARRTIVYVATLRRQPDGCWLFVVTGDFLRMAEMYGQGVAVLEPRRDESPS